MALWSATPIPGAPRHHLAAKVRDQTAPSVHRPKIGDLWSTSRTTVGCEAAQLVPASVDIAGCPDRGTQKTEQEDARRRERTLGGEGNRDRRLMTRLTLGETPSVLNRSTGIVCARRSCVGLIGLALLLAGCGRYVGPLPSPTPELGRVYYSTDSLATVYAIDWSGQQREVLAMPSSPPVLYPAQPGKPPPQRLWVTNVSPDGKRLLLNDGSIRDPAGRLVTKIDPHAGLIPAWADDGAHMCQLTTPAYSSFAGGTLGGPAVLTVVTPGSAARTVATVGQFGPNATATVAACSEHAGVAVIESRTASGLTQAAKTGLDPTTSLKVVRLSDGSVLWQKNYPVTTNPPGGYVTGVSADGRYVSETQLVVRVRGPVAPTVIRDLSTGQVVAALGSIQVEAFSGDDNLVIASTDQGAELIRWRTSESVARLPAIMDVAAYQPDGEAFMVIKRRPESAAHDLWLVSGDGSSRMLVGNILQVYNPSGR